MMTVMQEVVLIPPLLNQTKVIMGVRCKVHSEQSQFCFANLKWSSFTVFTLLIVFTIDDIVSDKLLIDQKISDSLRLPVRQWILVPDNGLEDVRGREGPSLH